MAQSLNRSSAERRSEPVSALNSSIAFWTPSIPSAWLFEDQLDQEITGCAVVLEVSVEVTATVAARLLPEVQEVGERGTVVLEAAAPAGEARSRGGRPGGT